MRVALFNVKHSPNLGDGLLAECLEREMLAGRPGWSVVALDLAGRERFGLADPCRRLKLKVLEALPGPARRRAAELALRPIVERRLRPRWREALRGADAVVVGGGNLFADADLNFPLKIAGALSEARALPVGVHAVGVTPNWSPRGARLFGEALEASRLIGATVRDERSRAAWGAMLRERRVAPARVALDPGLLAARHYPAAPCDAEPEVAVGITDPVAVKYHAARGARASGLADWYAAAVAALAGAGRRVALFTNGGAEDRRFLTERAGRLVGSFGDRVRVEPAFHEPGDLARFLSNKSLVVAHRMHACIAAHSFGVPTIGLAWDAKLQSFFELCGRSDHLIDPARVPGAAVAGLAERAIGEGVDEARRRALVDTAAADVAELTRALAGFAP